MRPAVRKAVEALVQRCSRATTEHGGYGWEVVDIEERHSDLRVVLQWSLGQWTGLSHKCFCAVLTAGDFDQAVGPEVFVS